MAKPAATSELTAHLGFWLRHVSNHVSQAFAAKVAAKGVTVAEWVMLRALYGHDAMAPSKLADDMGMTRGAISKLADRLIAKSLAARSLSRDDGRAQTLALTARGRQLVPALAAIADANDAEFFAHLSEAERRTLERLLKRTAAHHGLAGMPVT